MIMHIECEKEKKRSKEKESETEAEDGRKRIREGMEMREPRREREEFSQRQGDKQ